MAAITPDLRDRMRAAVTPDEEWPDPGDLSANPDQSSYPVDALPEPARAAIIEYQRFGQQPMPMVGSSALGQIALAAQPHADVARNDHLVSPISLYQASEGESGERKSAADKQFGRASRAWLSRAREARVADARRGRALDKEHNARLEGVRKRITSLAGKDPEADQAELGRLRDQLVALEQNPIFVPPLPHLTYEDITPAGLAHALAIGHPSAGLFSDEGGAFVGSHGMSEDTATASLSLFNILWDGRPYFPTRKQAETAELRGRRFSMFVMIQPGLLQKLITRGARQLGFLARCLLSAPDSTMGTRFYQDPPARWTALDEFDRHILRLLDRELPIETTGDDKGALMRLTPPVMRLSAPAKRRWVEYHDAVESELGRFGEFDRVRDIGSKSAENAVRIAAVFQIFARGGPSRELEAESMEGGIRLAAWHLAEARRLFFEIDAPQELRDARELSAWVATKASELTSSKGGPLVDENGEIALREILNRGPNAIRESFVRRDAAVAVLEGESHVQRCRRGKENCVRINPKLFRRASR